MRRAQIIGQVFIYTLAAITFAVILLFGYKAINNLVAQGRSVALLELRQQIQSAVSSMSSSPDVEKLVLSIPSKYRKICFVANATETNKLGTCLCMNCIRKPLPSGCPCKGGNESDFNAVICNAWKSDTRQNVFLVPMGDVEIAVGRMTLDHDYSCFEPVRGRVSLRLQGRGDSTYLTKWNATR